MVLAGTYLSDACSVSPSSCNFQPFDSPVYSINLIESCADVSLRACLPMSSLLGALSRDHQVCGTVVVCFFFSFTIIIQLVLCCSSSHDASCSSPPERDVVASILHLDMAFFMCRPLMMCGLQAKFWSAAIGERILFTRMRHARFCREFWQG